MLKVLHFQKVSGIGGSEQHLLALLPALGEAGIEVEMCVAASGEADRFLERLRERDVRTVVVSAGPHLNPRLLARLRRVVRQAQPDLLHTHLFHGDVYGQPVARMLGIPAISSMHGTMPFYRQQPYRLAARVAGHLSRRTIAISEHVGRFLDELRLTRPGTIRVIPYGIDPSLWLVSDRERALARSHLGVGAQDVVITIASRLIPGKGHLFLLDAVERAVRQAPELRVLVAGDGPLRKQLDQRARRLPAETVRVLGFVADVRTFIAAGDIHAVPTVPPLEEGFGLAALEAMAGARPVVATTTGSLPEVVAHGSTGVLVEPGAVDELAHALVTLVGNRSLREDMGRRGRERSESTFSLDTMVERTLKAYSETT